MRLRIVECEMEMRDAALEYAEEPGDPTALEHLHAAAAALAAAVKDASGATTY